MTRALSTICLATAFVALVSGAGTAAGAAVTRSGGDGNGSGNGRHNRNSFIINSPSESHDLQHIRNVNVSGNTITPAAVCKRHTGHCRIIQKIVVYPRWD